MQIVNKFGKACRVCRTFVEAGEGFAHKDSSGYWSTYCREHAPERIQEVKVERKLHADGSITTPYEPTNLPLIKSLPGARWNPEVKRWNVSTALADRRRVLEVAAKLGLEVAEELRLPDVQNVESPAVARAKAIGKLFPYQLQGVEWLSQVSAGLLGDDMGLGKAQALHAKLLTPRGWTTMGEIKIGDQVVGSDGRPTEVLAIYPQGVRPLYRVTFQDGGQAECDLEHLWAVNSPTRKSRGNPNRVLPLSAIKDDLRDRAGNTKHYIPVVRPVEFAPVDLPIHPYAMGYLLANGNFTEKTPRVTIPDERIALRLGELLSPLGVTVNQLDGIDYSITTPGTQPNPLTKILNGFSLWGRHSFEKFVPDLYRFAPLADRIDLLQGLNDGGGTVEKGGNVIEYSTTSSRLAEHVRELCWSLGGTARLKSKPESVFTYKGERRIGRPAFRVFISLPNQIRGFWVPTKASRYQPRTKYHPSRAIVSVEYIGEFECRCIRVAAEDHLYVTDSYAVTHNTVQTIVSLEDDDAVLLVVPASLKYNWKKEFATWRPAFKATVLEGKDSFRVPEPGEAVITNSEILPDYLEPLKPGVLSREELRLKVAEIEAEFDAQIADRPQDKWAIDGRKQSKIKALQEDQKNKKKARLQPVCRVPREILLKLENTVFVADEAHRYKNYQAARTAKVKQLSEICRKVLPLTGTPLLNRPTDLYGVLSSFNLARKVFGGNTWYRFVELFNGYKNRWGGWEFGSPDPIVPELLRRVMLRRRREDVLPDLPKKTYTTFTIGEISRGLQKKLDSLWSEQKDVLELTEELPSFEEFSAIRAELAAERVDTVLEYVEDHEEQGIPLVVFSAHRAPIDALKSREGWEVIYGGTPNEERQRIVDDFQAGKLKGVAGTVAAAGVGLTLTRAWKALFVDLDWTPALNSQAEDRICRIGQQSQKVEIVRMVTDHPLEKHIHNLLSEKIALIQASVEDTIEVSAPAEVREVRGETEEEYRARQEELRRLREEQEKALEGVQDQKARRAKEKAGEILERERAKASLPEVELTEEKISEVRRAFEHMLSVCDGAFSKDGQGFNKPDAAVAKFLSLTGLETETEIRAAERMLSRYHRQLSGEFPGLFGRGKKVKV